MTALNSLQNPSTHAYRLCPSFFFNWGIVALQCVLFSPPGDIPEPGIEPASPALQVHLLLLSHPRKPKISYPHSYVPSLLKDNLSSELSLILTLTASLVYTNNFTPPVMS